MMFSIIRPSLYTSTQNHCPPTPTSHGILGAFMITVNTVGWEHACGHCTLIPPPQNRGAPHLPWRNTRFVDRVRGAMGSGAMHVKTGAINASKHSPQVQIRLIDSRSSQAPVEALSLGMFKFCPCGLARLCLSSEFFSRSTDFPVVRPDPFSLCLGKNSKWEKNISFCTKLITYFLIIQWNCVGKLFHIVNSIVLYREIE